MEVLSGDLFTNDILWLFVSSQSQKDRLAQLAIVVLSVNLTWATSTDLSQWERFMTAGVIPSPQRHSCFLRQVDEWAGGMSDLLQLRIDARQKFFGKARANSAGEHEPVRTCCSRPAANRSISDCLPGAYSRR